MSPRGEFFAGFYDEKEFEEVEDKIFGDIDLRQVLVLWLPLAAFALILFAGKLVAGRENQVFMIFFQALWRRSWGAVQRQLDRGFSTSFILWRSTATLDGKTSSKTVSHRSKLFSFSCARFLGNLFLFFLLPFAGCISLCFCRSNADERFGSDDSFLGKKLTRRQLHYDEESDVDNEDVRLLRPTPPSSVYSAAFDGYQRSSETVFDVRDKPYSSREDEIEDDTSFVVNAIKESHESLRKLVSK